MLKFTKVFLLLELLVAAAHGDGYGRWSDIQNSQEDLKSDVKALKDLVRDLRTSLKQLQNVKPPTFQQRKVAFFVGLSKSLGQVNKDTDIVFNHVVTNIGSAYSSSTGRFTAPFTAAYQFSFTITAPHGKKAGVKMVRNNGWITTFWSVAVPDWAPSTALTVLWLKAGDQVWLQQLARVSYIQADMLTTFSGYLIFEN